MGWPEMRPKPKISFSRGRRLWLLVYPMRTSFSYWLQALRFDTWLDALEVLAGLYRDGRVYSAARTASSQSPTDPTETPQSLQVNRKELEVPHA
jgi:hypothetical protein